MKTNQPITKEELKEKILECLSDNPYLSIEYETSESGISLYLGDDEIPNNGYFARYEDFIDYIQTLIGSIEWGRMKDKLIFVNKPVYNLPLDSYTTKIYKVEPCKSFKNLQKWLEKWAGFTLGIRDLYCEHMYEKRGIRDYYSRHYLCEDDWYCQSLLDDLKKTRKSKCVIDVKIISTDTFEDGYQTDRYEYEQYGTHNVKLQVRFSVVGKEDKTFKIVE